MAIIIMGCGRSNRTNANIKSNPFVVAKDYTEIEGALAGEGVKTTRAWEATITPSLLEAKRQEFWRVFRGRNLASCLLLKQASEADAPTAKLLLDMSGFKLENGTMSVCISPNGHRYELPPFILSDPVKYKDPNMVKIAKKKVQESVIKIKLRTVFTLKEDQLEVPNTIEISALKQKYFELNGINDCEIRFFFGGKELQNNRTLISYGIENDMTILVYKKN